MVTTATMPVTGATPVRVFAPHRLTFDRSARMIAVGIFTEDEPIFLWKWQLVEKMTRGQPHHNALTELATIIFRLTPAGWHVRQEQPLMIAEDGMSEPDLMIGPDDEVPVVLDGREVGRVAVRVVLP